MDGALNSKPTKNGGGLLRTTTWGSLIALSILVAALGLTGHLPATQRGAAALQTIAPTASPQISASQPGAKAARADSFLSSTAKQISRLNPFSVGQGQKTEATVASSATQENAVVAPVEPATATRTAELEPKGQPQDSLSIGGSQDPEVLVAAKIAPDLKGIDPEAPVDVIVQFKSATGAPDLAR